MNRIVIWDEHKRRENRNKHGLDFADVVSFDWAGAIYEASHSNRIKAIGYFRDGTAVVIYAELGTEAISIISFRHANKTERNKL